MDFKPDADNFFPYKISGVYLYEIQIGDKGRSRAHILMLPETREKNWPCSLGKKDGIQIQQFPLMS